MTDANDAEIIEHLRKRVDRAGRNHFLTVESEHMRIVFRRIRELELLIRRAEPSGSQTESEGLIAALNLQTINAAAPGDFG